MMLEIIKMVEFFISMFFIRSFYLKFAVLFHIVFTMRVSIHEKENEKKNVVIILYIARRALKGSLSEIGR